VNFLRFHSIRRGPHGHVSEKRLTVRDGKALGKKEEKKGYWARLVPAERGADRTQGCGESQVGSKKKIPASVGGRHPGQEKRFGVSIEKRLPSGIWL